ncbi:hypothetical protein EsH8_VII_000397 [Colletotrichum jinshuiense]
MQLSKFIGLTALLGASIADAAAVVAYADGYEPTAEEHAQNLARAVHPAGAKLEARAGSATGCVQAHCFYLESQVGGDSIVYEIYQNGEYLFQLSGGASSVDSNTELQWNGLSDYKGRKWGFKSKGQCASMAYLNSFQSQYDYYTLSRTDLQAATNECPPCFEKQNGKKSCGTCHLREGIFSDGSSGQCYGYNGLSRCDFKSYCGRANSNTRVCGTNGSCFSV